MSTTEQTKPVFAEISEDGKSIEVYFKPSPKFIGAMHRLNGRFIGKDKTDVPHWTIPLEFHNARQLVIFMKKDNIEIGDALLKWGQREKELSDAVDDVLAGNFSLDELKRKNKKMYDAIHIGPLGKTMTDAERKKALAGPPSFQAKDVAQMSVVDGVLNANHPGLGKTMEGMATLYQRGLENGRILIIAPITSVEATWLDHLKAWTDLNIFVGASEKTGRIKRSEVLHEVQLMSEAGLPFVLIVNPEMVRVKKIDRAGGTAKENLTVDYRELFDIEWDAILADEVHKKGLRNPQSVTALGMKRLKLSERGTRMALTGTPMGGHPINLFGILHWLEPQRYSSKWKWANEFLQVASNGYGTVVGDVREDKQQDFDDSLKSILVRHTKEEAAPWLPAKDRIDLWCEMATEQAEQYKRFAEMAQIELGDETLTATSILAIYTRLKQFASAKCMFDQNGKLVPTNVSGKVSMLEDKLEELGIIAETAEDKPSDEQAVIFSQFSGVVEMVYEHLKSKGLKVVKMTGGSTRDEEGVKISRKEMKDKFQAGEVQVAVINTTAGGVSIDLDMANTAFLFDETWNPDDQEQAEDRVHRSSRIHQVTCYYLRSTGTLEQYIKSVTDAKGNINKKVLDERGLRLI